MLSQLTYKEYLKVTIPFMLSTATQPLLGAVNTGCYGSYVRSFLYSCCFFGSKFYLTIYIGYLDF